MNQSNNNGISAITNEINQENEEVIEEVEEVEEVEDLDLRKYSSKGPKKQKKNSGVGTVTKIDNQINKDDVINALVKNTDKPLMDLQATREYALIRARNISELCDNDNLRTLLGEEYKNMKFGEYIMRVNTLLPMLDFYRCSNVSGQFCSLAHIQGTALIIEKFLPFYQMNTEPILDERKKLKAINVRLVNRLFPTNEIRLYGVPGKTDTIGGEKATLTYAEKLAGCFPFLKTYTFKEGGNIATHINNLLNVLNEYKESYNAANGYPIEGNYVTMWRYSLDTIAHYYLERSLIPDMSEFTLNKLLDAFPLDSMARVFLEPYKTDDVEQVMKEFHIDTVTYRPKFGYFRMRNTLNELISMQYGTKLPLGKTSDYFSTKAMTKNINGPVGIQGKLNNPSSKQTSHIGALFKK